MTTLVKLPGHSLTETESFTPEQMKLITNTVAKGATPDELKLFLYRCRNLGLDPLKPGQIHFIKYGNNPGAIVIGIEGFRSRAAATGKLAGIKRGPLKDEQGILIGAWAEVYRSDWKECAREEVPLSEYYKEPSSGKPGPWQKMPETMIKKVAEAAALRMAFSDSLGGVYTSEEMDQAEVQNDFRNTPETPVASKTSKPQVLIRSKKVIGAEIVAASEKLNLTDTELREWAAEHSGVPSSSEMTIAQMESFLGVLQHELGRNGVDDEQGE